LFNKGRSNTFVNNSGAIRKKYMAISKKDKKIKEVPSDANTEQQGGKTKALGLA